MEIAFRDKLMTNISNQALLEEISRSATSPLVSVLATALSVEKAECDERLSVLIHQSVAAGNPVSEVMAVLIDIDEQLKKKGGEIPFATRLAPLVVELLSYAQSRHLRDKHQSETAESSPVFFLSRKTVVAAAGHISQKAAFSRFSERLLGIVLKHRVKKVLLQPPNRTDDNELTEAVTFLIQDLESQRIRVSLISPTE